MKRLRITRVPRERWPRRESRSRSWTEIRPQPLSKRKICFHPDRGRFHRQFLQTLSCTLELTEESALAVECAELVASCFAVLDRRRSAYRSFRTHFRRHGGQPRLTGRRFGLSGRSPPSGHTLVTEKLFWSPIQRANRAIHFSSFRPRLRIPRHIFGFTAIG